MLSGKWGKDGEVAKFSDADIGPAWDGTAAEGDDATRVTDKVVLARQTVYTAVMAANIRSPKFLGAFGNGDEPPLRLIRSRPTREVFARVRFTGVFRAKGSRVRTT